MNQAPSTSFAVSDVTPASQPLYEIPYPHAVAGLIGAPFLCREMSQLDKEICAQEQNLQRMAPLLLKELEEPLPSWMEDNRRAGLPEEAEAEIARRRAQLPDLERALAELKQRRPQLATALAAHFQSASHGIEACSRDHGHLVADIAYHPAIAALHRAFSDHRPVSLSPDMIWLLIAQGVANHINVRAETLRSRLVQHQGKVKLEVRRDDFVKGTPENPWVEVFPLFSRQIREHVGSATHDFFLAGFSTTGPAEKAAYEVVLMDAMQSYFHYVLLTVCGIPAITLEGTPEDWRLVLERASMLPRFGLGWWRSILEPILRQFVAAAEGRPDMDFWKSIYKYHSFSGGNAVTGWITAFFPYLKERISGQPTRRNEWLHRDANELQVQLYAAKEEGPNFANGPAIDQFPSGLSKAPVLWEYYDQRFDMEFLAGFLGVAQDAQTLCLRPEIGWAVREVTGRDPSA